MLKKGLEKLKEVYDKSPSAVKVLFHVSPLISLPLLLSDYILGTTKSVLILGQKGAGKTMMWNYLRGIAGEPQVTQYEHIKTFVFAHKKNGVPLRIASTVDIGGQATFVSNYEQLIEADSHILFFCRIDSVQSEDEMQDIRARLEKIRRVAEGKATSSIGLTIVLTYADRYARDVQEQLCTAFRENVQLPAEALMYGSMVEGDLKDRVKERLKAAYE